MDGSASERYGNASACSSAAYSAYDGVTPTLGLIDNDMDDDVDYVSVGNAVAAAVAPVLLTAGVDGMTFVEESGYSDPFGNGKDFNLLEYIQNDENSNINTPMDSPLEYGSLPQQQFLANLNNGNLNYGNNGNNNNNCNNNINNNNNVVGGGNNGGYANPNLQAPLHIDHHNVLYTTTNNAVVGRAMNAPTSGGGISGGGPMIGGGGHHHPHHHRGTNRILDSPPITDSSASPSSGGSASGDSPFSPTSINTDSYGRSYHNPNGVLNENILLSMHNNYSNGAMNGSTNLQHQMQLHQQRIMMSNQAQSQQASAQKLSPHSEFRSPYPPCQSTPGSQHSSSASSAAAMGGAQISPPNFSPNMDVSGNGGGMRGGMNGSSNGGANYIPPFSQQQQSVNAQQQQRQYAMNGGDLPSVKGEIQQTPNGGYKRRRTNAPNMTATIMSSVKSEENGGVKNNGMFSQHHSNGGSRTNLNFVPFHPQQPSQPQSNDRSGSSSGSNNGGGGGCGSGSGSSSINGDAQTSISGCGGQPAPPLSNHSTDYDYDDTVSINGTQRSIKFTPFFPESWLRLYDNCSRIIEPLTIHIVADKGFNFLAADNCFVNQKKNHFQITVHISRMSGEPPYWIQSPTGELNQITEYRLQFCGVKSEMPSSEIPINQSQSDRRPVALDGVELKMNTGAMTKQTVPRLHFSQTTMNNHRKNRKPNPEQKFFLLVVRLVARTPAGDFVIQAYQSDRVIVRASNPGQFEQPECGASWQQSANDDLLHFGGQVAIGTDKALDVDAKLSVLGNVFTTGQVTRPSDRRVKEDIANMDTSEAMSRISQMRIVEYNYKKEIAEKWGIEQNRHRVGVIAQELEEVLPDAVRDNGEFLSVDDTRIFYDTVAAAQELYRLTGNLECKIDQVEKISQKLARFAQRRRQLGSMASGISDFSNLFGASSSLGLNGNLNKLIMDNNNKKDYLSQSRVSLTSAPAAPYNNDDERIAKERIKSKRHAANGGQYRRCRSVSAASSYSYCHRGRVPDNALCSSKVTQGTIITLVMIMALCLVAMCTLYVMDWYNRTYIYAPHIHQYSHSPHVHSGGMGSGGPHSGGYPPPVVDPEAVGHYVTENEAEENSPWHMLEFVKSSAKTWGFAAMLLAGAQCAAKSHCPMFCCAAPQQLLMHGVAPKWAAENAASGANIELLTTKPPAPLSLELRATSAITSSLRNFSATEKAADALADDDEGRLESGVRIEVLNLRTVLDATYCAPQDGCEPRAGRYNLYVPISPYLPTIPLRLKFSIGEGLFVDNCQKLHKFEDKACSDFDESAAASRRLSETVFEVPAGGFLQSGYSFRVGYTTESCRMDAAQIGRAFDEYNIAFYRVCDDPATDSPTPVSGGIGGGIGGGSSAQRNFTHTLLLFVNIIFILLFFFSLFLCIKFCLVKFFFLLRGSATFF